MKNDDREREASSESKEDRTEGERLAEEVRELKEVDAEAGDGRGEPGDGSAGATGPGGSAS